MTENNNENEFSRIFNLSQVNKSVLELDLKTSDRECENLALRFSIQKIDSVSAKCSMKKLSQNELGDYRLSVQMKAKVVQQCVMTLKDINESIDEEFDIIFQIAHTDEHEQLPTVVDFDVDDEDLEIIMDTEIDLGEYISEYLSLSLNPDRKSVV